MERLRTMRRNRDKESERGESGDREGLQQQRKNKVCSRERERGEREDVTTRMQVCKCKKYIYHTERNIERWIDGHLTWHNAASR